MTAPDIKATVEELESTLQALMRHPLGKDLHAEWEDCCRRAVPSLLAELRRCWDMIERARKESKTDGDMWRLLSEFSLRSDKNAMARELEQASAKLVEQQNEIVRLRAIGEAARRYREALDVFNRQFVDKACPELAMAKQDACNALFALLDAKPSGGEEGKA